MSSQQSTPIHPPPEQLDRPFAQSRASFHRYAARVHDPHTYDVVSRDLIQRWACPITPDANLLPGCSYRCNGHCIYQEEGVSLARSCEITRDTVLGKGTTVGERAVIEASVLGRGTTVGAGVSLRGCYLLENVLIEDGATLFGCICCAGTVVRRNANVPPGCVLGRNVQVGSGVSLLPYARFQTQEALALSKQHTDSFDEEEDDEEDDEDEEDDDSDRDWNERGARRSVVAATSAAKVMESAKLDSGPGEGLLGTDGVGVLWRVVPTSSSIGGPRLEQVGPARCELSEEEDEQEDMVDIDIEARLPQISPRLAHCTLRASATGRGPAIGR